MMSTLLFSLGGFLLGASLGSFAKVVADRSLLGQPFLLGRSACPSCHHPLVVIDLIPVFSYLIQRGKCRYCHKLVSPEYLLVEVAMGFLIAALFWQVATVGVTLTPLSILDLVFRIFLVVILSIVVLTDLKKNLIPDKIIIPSLWITLIYLLMLTIFKVGYLYYYLSQTEVGRLLLPPHTDYFQRHTGLYLQNLLTSIGAGLLTGLFFLSLVVLTKGRGMGGGDVKLGAFLGLSLGLPLGLLAVMVAFVAGALVGLGLIMIGRKKFGQTIPFGPFLSLGGLIALNWGQPILDWYLNLRLI